MAFSNIPADHSFQIRIEGESIILRFTRTSTSTGTVSWNIPIPDGDCSDDAVRAYDGIVVTLDTVHVTVENRPVDGTIYTGDPTADTNLHAGDKIGTALVIGALYGDKTTISFDVTGLQPNTPYYVQGYAVDAQYRYHTEGVHAYSLNYGDKEGEDLPARQTVELNDSGVLLTDGTGLTSTTSYQFKIKINGTEYTATINGANAPTYNTLINSINTKFKLLLNPLTSPVPLGAGIYYWDGTTLFQWDGFTNVPVANTIVDQFDPAMITPGEYWYNPSTNQLSLATGSPANWLLTPFIDYYQDPAKPSCNDFWINAANGYVWGGTTWCQLTTYSQVNNPCLGASIACGTYWYDSTNLVLYKWNVDTQDWVQTFAILWDEDPNNLSPLTYWFDNVNNKLFQRTGSPLTWNEVPVTISSTEPTLLIAGSLWFDPDTEELFEATGGSPEFNELDVLVWPEDPTDRESCDLWWNSVTDKLNVWNVVDSTWEIIADSMFIQESADPRTCPSITVNSLWFKTDTEELFQFDGTQWLPITTFLNQTTDPTDPNIGDVWHDTTNDVWASWNGTAWISFIPIISNVDPQAIPNGVFWFDTSLNILYQRNGGMWVPVSYVQASPEPAIGTTWFNPNTNELKEWNGTTWVTSTPAAIVELDSNGNLKFTTGKTGSSATIKLTDITLFDGLTASAVIGAAIDGSDGTEAHPSYALLGIGTDGTVDERRDMIYSLKAQLGYPVVDVELTDYQLDTAVTEAIESFRKRSGAAYRRAFFLLDLVPRRQQYLLTNKRIGYNKIVTITGVYRMTSAFLSSAHGSGVFGQVVLQHLYNMGTYDLTSFHLVSQYVEQLEHLFASRIVFNWYEAQRILFIEQAVTRQERVLLDVAVERTEQDLLKDRWTKSWISRRAEAEMLIYLSRIRGKYSTLPGAGGGVALNAADLYSQAQEQIDHCHQQLDDYIANMPEEYGMGAHFVMG